MVDFEDHPHVVVADVDCTTEMNKPFCVKKRITGYPTMRYWTLESGQEGTRYYGDRSHEGLKKFIDETLQLAKQKGCKLDKASDRDICSEKEEKYITEYAEKSPVEVTKELRRLYSMVGRTINKNLMNWVRQRRSILKQYRFAQIVVNKKTKENENWFMRTFGHMEL